MDLQLVAVQGDIQVQDIPLPPSPAVTAPAVDAPVAAEAETVAMVSSGRDASTIKVGQQASPFRHRRHR